VEFRILGPLEVWNEGRRLDPGSGKPRALLAVLLLRPNEILSTAYLIEALWGEHPPLTAQKALQRGVSQLRRVLGEEAVLTRAPGYALSVDPDRVDAGVFERLFAEGRQLVEDDPHQATQRLQDALALWRGPALPEFALEEFAHEEIARLEELRILALEERFEADLRLGRHAEIVPELERAVSRHPLRERLRAQLMLALYRCNRQAEALAVYQKGRRLLADELGLKPAPPLQGLERAILNQDPALDLALQPIPRSDVAAPTGTVTFVFTDIEASTRLVRELGERYGVLLDQHNRLVRRTLGKRGGHEVDNQGDAFFFAFGRARDAVAGAVELQRVITTTQWPEDLGVRVRIGINTGEPGVAEAGYHGIDVVRASRIASAAHGGQIVVSRTTRDLVGDAGEDVQFRDLGEHRLKGLDPEQLFQVSAPGLAHEFGSLRTEAHADALEIGGREQELAEAAGAVVERGNVQRRRRLRTAAVVAAAVLTAATVTVIALARANGPAGARSVAPNSLVKIDPRTNAIVDVDPVGNDPIFVASVDPWIFTANVDDGTVTRVDRVGEVRTFGVSAWGLAGSPEGTLWTGSSDTGDLIEVDPGSLGTLRRIRLPGRRAVPGVVSRRFLWASEPNDNALYQVDLSSGRPARRFANVGAGAIALQEGIAYAESFDGLVRIDASGNVRRLTSITGSKDVEVGFGSVWVSTFLAGRVYRVHPFTGEVEDVVDVGDGPLVLAVGAGAVWVTNERAGTISRIDPRTNTVTAIIRTGHYPKGITVARHFVWVAVSSVRF
jgi:YVTN family beta-propeller protein